MLEVARPNPNIPDVILLRPVRHEDPRGWFCESYNERTFTDAGVNCAFVQDNQTYSAHSGTVRGLHFQAPPHAQNKLIRVLKGRIVDVALDIRRGSPSFGRHVRVELDAERGDQLFIPSGFAHGFATLSADVEVLYKVDACYDRDSEGAIRWDDPRLEIDWGVSGEQAVISPRDAAAPLLDDLNSPFAYAE